jgi:replicative DNA helicase
LDCVVIDYLGLVRPEDSKMPREQQVAEISRMSKQLAKELNIPVFLICQLNRDSVKKGSEPQLHDLRESGQIEQDADVVLLLHRDLLGDKENVSIIVAKNRFGGVGHSKNRIKFLTKSQRFCENNNENTQGGIKHDK